MSDARYQALTKALDELVASMQRNQLWASSAPDAKALASTQPFCVDTLTLEQWLQFVMVPTFMAMMANKQALPETCDIYPMAEHVWPQAYPDVRVCIKAVDNVISTGTA